LSGLKGKLLLLLALVVGALFAFCLSVQVTAQTDTIIWRDEMNYQSFDQMQTAGWTSEHPDGVSFGSNGVILDQTHGDTAVHYIGHFSSGIYDWKVEDQSRWITGDHSGNDISALTEKHSYGFSADGWYSNFAFYHDGSKVYTSEKGTYSENKNTLFTLSIVKIGTQINCYYNGQLEYTYIESDSAPSQLNGVDAVSPWQGSSEYDYFQLSSASVFPSSVSPQSDNIFSNPLVVGGIIGGVSVGVGLAVYFGFIAGGNAGAGGAAGASTGSGSIITNNPTNPSTGAVQSNPSSDADSGNLGIGPINDQITNITDINNFWSDFIQDPTGNIISTEPVNPSYSNAPETIVDNGPSTPTPQTSENQAPQHQTLTDILQLIDQGEHIATDAFNQGTMNQDSYQHYLEQTTNIMQTINQSITQQSQLGHDAIDGASSR
jgi:hypothetical protein